MPFIAAGKRFALLGSDAGVGAAVFVTVDGHFLGCAGERCTRRRRPRAPAGVAAQGALVTNGVVLQARALVFDLFMALVAGWVRLTCVERSLAGADSCRDEGNEGKGRETKG